MIYLVMLLTGCSNWATETREKIGQGIFEGYTVAYQECLGPVNNEKMSEIFIRCMETKGWYLAPTTK